MTSLRTLGFFLSCIFFGVVASAQSTSTQTAPSDQAPIAISAPAQSANLSQSSGSNQTTSTARFSSNQGAGAPGASNQGAGAPGANNQGAGGPGTNDDETRPATTTFFGDTGLWFVPTGEVLGHGKWSVSGYRRGTKFIQGYSNIGDFAGTFGVGIKDRAEIFGAFLFDTRIDRDVRPVFVNDPAFGGIVDRYPRVNQYWTGDNVGDFYVGVKYNFLSEYRQDPAAVAVRGMVKLPTGNADNGVSPGKLV